MTWFANQVFAEPTRDVIAAFARIPGLRRHLFHLRDLSEHRWPFPEKYAHGLPAGGLLVAREVCDLDSLAGEENDDAVSWNALVGPPDLPLDIQPEELTAQQPDLNEADLPPPAFLRFLKHVATDTRTVVSYFVASTFAGRLEYAYSFVFGPRERAYVHVEEGLTHEIEKGAIRGHPVDVIALTLRHHRLLLRTQYFAPLDRAFDWPRHRWKGLSPV